MGTAGERSCFPFAGRSPAGGERSSLYSDVVRGSISWAKSFFTSKVVVLAPFSLLLVSCEEVVDLILPHTLVPHLVTLYLSLALWELFGRVYANRSVLRGT